MKIFQSILCIMLLGISVASWGQEKKAYRLFDANGKEVGYREMMKVLKNQDVVFLGEVHNCAIAHCTKESWLLDWKCWKQTISWFWTNM